MLHQASSVREHDEFLDAEDSDDWDALIFEIVIERYSLKPTDFDERITKTKICIVQLPQVDRVSSRRPTSTADELGGRIDLMQQAIESELRTLKGLSVTNLMKVI